MEVTFFKYLLITNILCRCLMFKIGMPPITHHYNVIFCTSKLFFSNSFIHFASNCSVAINLRNSIILYYSKKLQHGEKSCFLPSLEILHDLEFFLKIVIVLLSTPLQFCFDKSMILCHSYSIFDGLCSEFLFSFEKQ
ncbi:hypothetical protein P9112_006719 [Eukaryota sp. TZLM1-RC]